MIPVPSSVKVWLATGHTDMRKGFPGLSLMVQEALKRDPMCGHLFVFRGRWHGGDHACAARLPVGEYLLADAAKDLAADVGRMSKNTGMTGSNMIPFCHEQCDRRASG